MFVLLRIDRKFWEAKRGILHAAEQLRQSIGETGSNDLNLFQKDVNTTLKTLKLKWGDSELLRQKLHTAIQTSRARLEKHQGGEA